MAISTLETFFDLFIKELQQNKALRDYHRVINSAYMLPFRKAYMYQRLQYIVNQLPSKRCNILDVGCGYGTTSILLGSLGHKVTGTTLEYYFEEIENRLTYWQKHTDTSSLEFRYENLYNAIYPDKEFDYIIVQDTLHHLEPIDKAITIFHRILKDDGKILVSEENGNNIIGYLKNLKKRGFKRIVQYHDNKLNETLLFGNENTRGMKAWRKIFDKNGFFIDEKNLEYIRFFSPGHFHKHDYQQIIEKEKNLWKRSSLLRELLFFGINFMAGKKSDTL